MVGFLSLAMLNTVEIAKFYFQKMEVENATQMGAQAAWKTCDTTKLPATTNCSGLTTAITTAISSTSLGNAVTLQTGFPQEGYYCLNTSNTLVYASNVSSKPANCSATGQATLQPGDYIKIQTQYSYSPIFPGFTIGSLLPTSITSTSMMRLQ